MKIINQLPAHYFVWEFLLFKFLSQRILAENDPFGGTLQLIITNLTQCAF